MGSYAQITVCGDNVGRVPCGAIGATRDLTLSLPDEVLDHVFWGRRLDADPQDTRRDNDPFLPRRWHRMAAVVCRRWRLILEQGERRRNGSLRRNRENRMGGKSAAHSLMARHNPRLAFRALHMSSLCDFAMRLDLGDLLAVLCDLGAARSMVHVAALFAASPRRAHTAMALVVARTCARNARTVPLPLSNSLFHTFSFFSFTRSRG